MKRRLRWLTILGWIVVGFFALVGAATVVSIVVAVGGYTPGAALLPRGEIRCASGTADPERLRASVEALARRFQPRNYDYPSGLERAADYVAEQLKASGAEVRDQRFDVRGDSFRNVVARFGPPDGRDRIIIGAHYDTAEVKPGADDNASGVAGLIELARMIGASSAAASSPLPVTIELVAYTLEEQPNFDTDFMGSAVHAASVVKDGAAVRLMISLEMIGYFTDKPSSQRLPLSALGLVYPTVGNFISVIGALEQARVVTDVKRAMRARGSSGVPVESMSAPAIVPGIDFSDHRSYAMRGFPAVMVTDTAFYRNPNYHSKADLPETLDYERMARVVEQVHCAVNAFASAPAAAAITASSSGASAAR